MSKRRRRRAGQAPKAAREQACRDACLETLRFRNRHDPLGEGRGAVECIPDAERDRQGATHRTRDTLDLLYDRRTITLEQLGAGRRFERDFRLANLDHLRAGPMMQLPRGRSELADSTVGARRRIGEAMARLGWGNAPNGAIAWNVLGLGMTLAGHAEASVLGTGRSLDKRMATGVLLGALDLLERHYDKRRKKTA